MIVLFYEMENKNKVFFNIMKNTFIIFKNVHEILKINIYSHALSK